MLAGEPRRYAAWLAGFDDSTTHWDEFVRSVPHQRKTASGEWGVPAYNGGLFSEEPAGSQVGGTAGRRDRVPKASFGPILTNLLVDETRGRASARWTSGSLGVREFGTIYEGLLESELSVAEVDLVVGQPRASYAPR